MREAEEKQSFLRDVDEETFAWFAEFICGGDYNASKPLIVLNQWEAEWHSCGRDSPPEPAAAEVFPAEEIPPDPPPQEEDRPDNWTLRYGSKTKRKRDIRIPIRKRLSLFADFSLPQIDKVSFPKINDGENGSDIGLIYDYAEAFCHVRLYMFAEQYQIKDLKDLVMCKLHSALQNTAFHPLRVEELCDLIRLVYQNTPDLKSKEEPLRSLMTHYMACNFEELVPMEKFQELLIPGGIIVTGLCQKVSRRL